jgi:hypothetical protein
MTEGQSGNPGNTRSVEPLAQDLRRRDEPIGLVTTFEMTESDTDHTVENTRAAELLEQAIDSIGALADVLEHQDCATR